MLDMGVCGLLRELSWCRKQKPRDRCPLAVRYLMGPMDAHGQNPQKCLFGWGMGEVRYMQVCCQLFQVLKLEGRVTGGLPAVWQAEWRWTQIVPSSV